MSESHAARVRLREIEERNERRRRARGLNLPSDDIDALVALVREARTLVSHDADCASLRVRSVPVDGRMRLENRGLECDCGAGAWLAKAED